MSSSEVKNFWWTSGANTEARRPTCGILVIGDEILNGSTRDTNSHYLCAQLHKRGVSVKKIAVVGDHVDEIASEMKLFSRNYDVVLTTGGIGPTHDDRTFESLGKAFNVDLTINQQLYQVVEVFLKKTKLHDVDAAVEKFCKIPITANLLWGSAKPPKNPQELTTFPSVQLENVVCFPGVPKFCQMAYDQLEDTIFPREITSAFFNKAIYFKRNEVYLQEDLSRIADMFSQVNIGSYPIMDNSYFKTKVVVESADLEKGKEAFKSLMDTFSDYVVNYDEEAWVGTSEKLDVFINEIQDKSLRKRLVKSIEVIDDVLNKYGPDKIAISFNGGKDCTALLHLLRARVDKKFGSSYPIHAFHILCGDEFSEMADFIREAGNKYNLDTQELNGPMKQGLETLKKRKPHVVAVFMGSRFTDPNGKFMQSECEWTDPGWPKFYRVCPLLPWHYVDIWSLLRSLCVPYCALYDAGYTSLGDRNKTRKNSVLELEDGKYLPAYKLYDDALERFGRMEGDQTPKM